MSHMKYTQIQNKYFLSNYVLIQDVCLWTQSWLRPMVATKKKEMLKGKKTGTIKATLY